MDKIRKVFRLVLKNEKEQCFCEACINRPLWNGKLERSFEVDTGICNTCGYQRDEEIIVLEQIEKINTEIEELRRVIKDIIDSHREIRIEDIVFYRTEKYDTLFENLGDPSCIRKCFQFPIPIEQDLMVEIIERQIERLKARKKGLTKKIPV